MSTRHVQNDGIKSSSKKTPYKNRRKPLSLLFEDRKIVVTAKTPFKEKWIQYVDLSEHSDPNTSRYNRIVAMTPQQRADELSYKDRKAFNALAKRIRNSKR